MLYGWFAVINNNNKTAKSSIKFTRMANNRSVDTRLLQGQGSGNLCYPCCLWNAERNSYFGKTFFFFFALNGPFLGSWGCESGLGFLNPE